MTVSPAGSRIIVEAFAYAYGETRAVASERIGRLSDQQILEDLLRILQAHAESQPQVRWRTARALGQLGNQAAVGALIQALRDEDPLVRVNAVHALGDLHDRSAVEPLIEALSAVDWELRAAAASTLGTLKDHRAVDSLILLLNDADVDVRYSAASALGDIGDARALSALLWTQQNDPGETHQDQISISETAATAIKLIQERQVTEPQPPAPNP